jgi:ABC-type Zn uptake system ZnuABC Zn-binding protein ZnuA
MGFDQSSLETQLTAIQAAITAALSNPRPDWQVGQVRFNQSSYLKYLMEMQDQVIKQLQSIPEEVVTTTHVAIDEFGQDLTQYQNEPQT